MNNSKKVNEKSLKKDYQKNSKKVYSRSDKAITLIALIVTIVILLILAGISIQAITNTGLFANAKKSKEESKRADADEQLKLMLYEWSMERAEDNIALIDFLNKKVEDSKIEYVEETDDGIEVYIDGYMEVLDNKGNVIQEMQRTIARPEITYTLSSTEPNQDKVTIVVKAIVNDKNIMIKNIVNPNNEEIMDNEVEFEVTKNGKYKFTANTSAGTKKSCVVEITNIKISTPVITLTQKCGYPTLTSNGITAENSNSKIAIKYEENINYKNVYSEDNGITWKEYKGETEVTSNKILAKTIMKNNTSIESETAIFLISAPSDALGEKAYDGDYGTYNGLESDNGTFEYWSGTKYINVKPEDTPLNIKIYYTRHAFASITLTFYKTDRHKISNR